MNINNQLIGFVQVDIETPEDLKEKFSEMTPIFKNAEIKFDDIDEYMQNYHNYNDIPFNKPKKNIYNEWKTCKQNKFDINLCNERQIYIKLMY